jgi:hypothetical protein
MDVGAALRTLWKDTCSVVEYQEVAEPNGSTGFAEVTVIEGEPCRLSFKTLAAVNQSDNDAVLVQTAKLFCDETIIVKPGSKIVVKRGERVFEYGQSGEPAIYPGSHQEIVLVPFEDYA